MRTEATKKLFTVDDYYRMGEAGIFKKNEHIELINGEILIMSPIGSRHAARVDRVTALFVSALGNKAIVRAQNPLRLDDYNEPQPDIILLKPRRDYYESRHPGAKDVFLVMEIADTSLRYDLNVKLNLYAISAVPEYWVEDIDQDAILVHRNPVGEAYTTCLTFRRGSSLSPLAFPDLAFKVDEILG